MALAYYPRRDVSHHGRFRFNWSRGLDLILPVFAQPFERAIDHHQQQEHSGPVKDCPTPQPVAFEARCSEEAHRHKVTQILPDGSRGQVDDEKGWAKDQHKEPDSKKDPDIQVADELDAPFQSRIYGQGKDGRQNANDQIGPPLWQHPAVLVLQSTGELQGDQTGGGGQAAQRSKDSKDV
jgi:hypothetical protein